MLTPALVGSEVVLEQSCIRMALLFREYRIPPPASVRSGSGVRPETRSRVYPEPPRVRHAS